MNPHKTRLLWLVCSCTDLPSTKSCMFLPVEADLLMDASRQLFASSRLDYCNSMLVGAADCAMQKFQGVQNAIERLITWSRRFDRIIPVLRCLHWLAMLVSSVFAVRRHRSRRVLSSSCWHRWTSSSHLWSVAFGTLEVPRTATSFGCRSFSVLFGTVSRLLTLFTLTFARYLKVFVLVSQHWLLNDMQLELVWVF